ncbi:hypothetical protein FDP41_012459 [Naegleria fowleri]|uniref:Uncharacterized protein n=1 Tax=Naegleria fowleri TaxID=5763 RepID=A0A6A5C4U0_NAEFO|nr:uncharacterized protein FDP41_012459 [Naegleria fowleri]KAF0981802.1 hypothetical protein FDP41_012459 [Naegleria fowleri]
MSSDTSTPNLPNDFPSTRPPQTIIRKKVMVRRLTSAHQATTPISSNNGVAESMTNDTLRSKSENQQGGTNPRCHTPNTAQEQPKNDPSSLLSNEKEKTTEQYAEDQNTSSNNNNNNNCNTIIENNSISTSAATTTSLNTPSDINSQTTSASGSTYFQQQHSNIIKRIIEKKSSSFGGKSSITIAVKSPTNNNNNSFTVTCSSSSDSFDRTNIVESNLSTTTTTTTVSSPNIGITTRRSSSSSSSEVSIPSQSMRARSVRAVACSKQASDRDFNPTLNECEKLKSTRKFGDLERVCRDFLTRYFSSDVKMAKIYLYLACALREGLLFRDALKYFNEALKIDSSLSKKSTFLRDYGHTLVCDEQYELANQYFEKSLLALEKESNTNDMADKGELKSAMFMCTILGDKSNVQDINLQSYLTTLDTNHALTHYAIGLYYERKCDYQNAIQYYKSSQIKEPSFDCAYERVGMCYLKLGVLERAKSSLDLACTLNRQNFRALFELAKLHLRSGSTANCKIKLKCIIERSSTLVDSTSDRLRLYQYLAESYYLLAIIKYSSESEESEKSETLFNQAIRYFTRYHDLVQKFPDKLANYSTENYYNTLGLCHMYSDHAQEAGECFAKAIEFEPQSPFGYYNLGVLFEMNELYDDALESFSHALKLSPMDTDCKFAVKRVTRKKKNAIFTNYGLIGTEIINN